MKVKTLFYDVETTGTNYMKHSIIELAGIIEIDGVERERFEWKVRPHPKAVIEEPALKANGHKREDLDTYPPMEDVHAKLKKQVCKYIDPYDRKDKFHLIGYNNRGFDDNFLRMLFTLCGDNFFGSLFWADSIDVMSSASHHLMHVRHTMPSFKLHRVAKTLGIPVDDSKLHQALYDIELTREVYRKVCPESMF